MSNGFNRSFEKGFLQGADDSSKAAREAIQEKIKQDQAKAENQYKATTMRNSSIAAAYELGGEELAKKVMTVAEAAGNDPDAQKNVTEFIKTFGDQQKQLQDLKMRISAMGAADTRTALSQGYRPVEQKDFQALTEAGMRSNPNPVASLIMNSGQRFIKEPGLGSTSSSAQPIKAFTIDNSGKASVVMNPEGGDTFPAGSKIFESALKGSEIAERESARIGEQQKVFKESEIEYVSNLAESRDSLKDLVSGLGELGIKDPSKYGVIESETIDSAMGPISIPAKYNLVGQYAKDPKYTAMKRKLDRFFNKYRKAITGAQAGFKELEVLQAAIGTFQDRPGVFFENIGEIQKELDKALSTRLDIYDDVGRDTSRMRKRLGVVSENSSSNLDTLFEGL